MTAAYVRSTVQLPVCDLFQKLLLIEIMDYLGIFSSFMINFIYSIFKRQKSLAQPKPTGKTNICI